jgi:2-C-methyl-D-erythritol 4-phosphate cytidylyltransferase
MRYWLVMPAAGAGRRFGAAQPKQYAPLLGSTVIEWALAPFLADERCAGVVVAVAVDDAGWEAVAARLESSRPARSSARASLRAVPGGAQRSLSVRSGLAALAGSAQAEDWVLVHDAARPCLEPRDLERLLSRLASHPVGGLLALPAADTLKRAEQARDGGAPPAVASTVDRTALWRALTPQMFRYGRLCAALDAAHALGRFPTDEAQALEWRGEHPLLIEGSSSNLKITAIEDLALATAVLRSRRTARAALETS